MDACGGGMGGIGFEVALEEDAFASFHAENGFQTLSRFHADEASAARNVGGEHRFLRGGEGSLRQDGDFVSLERIRLERGKIRRVKAVQPLGAQDFGEVHPERVGGVFVDDEQKRYGAVQVCRMDGFDIGRAFERDFAQRLPIGFDAEGDGRNYRRAGAGKFEKVSAGEFAVHGSWKS